jgi:hypothetical protein
LSIFEILSYQEMEGNCEFRNSRRVFEQIKKKHIFVISQFLYINRCRISRQISDVHYLWVLMLSLRIISQTLFQWRWIESGKIQENCHFYLFEIDKYLFIIERKGIFKYLGLKNKFLKISQFSLRTRNLYPILAVRKNNAVKNI